MDHKKQLALLITNYLKKEMKSGRFNDEALVRLEIATQCIESAYKITPSKHRDDISSIQLDCMLKEYKKILRSEKLIRLLDSLSEIEHLRKPKPFKGFEYFWGKFAEDKIKVKSLKVTELDSCPAYIIENDIETCFQLEVLNPSSTKKSHLSNDNKNTKVLSTVNLGYLSELKNLNELRLNGISRIQLISMPLFNDLTNLKTLSLTSINEFPEEIYKSLETVTTNLENLELGDCNTLSKTFVVLIKRFTNLKSLRLENCDNWEKCSKNIFNAIRSLKKLKSLELINIKFNACIKNELEKCTGIQSLGIIPTYDYESAAIHCNYVVDCLKKLYTVLNHLVWGVTEESLLILDMYYTEIPKKKSSTDCNVEVFQLKKKKKCKPIKNVINQTSEVLTTDKKNKSNIKEFSVSALQNYLELIMKTARIKVIKVPFSETTKVYLSDQFNDL